MPPSALLAGFGVLSCTLQLLDRPPRCLQPNPVVLAHQHVGDQLLHAVVQGDRTEAPTSSTSAHSQRFRRDVHHSHNLEPKA